MCVGVYVVRAPRRVSVCVCVCMLWAQCLMRCATAAESLVETSVCCAPSLLQFASLPSPVHLSHARMGLFAWIFTACCACIGGLIDYQRRLRGRVVKGRQRAPKAPTTMATVLGTTGERRQPRGK